MFNEIYLFHNISLYLPISDIINLMYLNKKIYKNRKILTKIFSFSGMQLIFNKFDYEKIKNDNTKILSKSYNFIVYTFYNNIDFFLIKCSINSFNIFIKTLIKNYQNNLNLCNDNEKILILLKVKYIINNLKKIL